MSRSRTFTLLFAFSTLLVCGCEGNAASEDGDENQPADKKNDRQQVYEKLGSAAIALHNYHDVEGVFPPNAHKHKLDSQNMPLLSWRVYILPYIGEEELYKQFNLDEPWDSEHNKPLLAKRPDLYALNADLGEGLTDVLSPQGNQTVLGAKITSRGRVISEITDGSSSTAMLIEGSPEHAVPWTKPGDFTFDPAADEALSRFGQPGAKEFGLATVSVDIYDISKDIPAETLNSLFIINDRGDSNDQPINRYKVNKAKPK